MFRNRKLSVITWLRLLRVAQKVSHGGSEHITAHGLSGAMFDVLSQIAADEGLSQQELAEQLLVTKGNVSQLLSKLEQSGFIEKRQQAHEKRLYLSPKAKALLEEIMPKHDDFIAERMSQLNEEELRQLNDLLRKLDKGLT